MSVHGAQVGATTVLAELELVPLPTFASDATLQEVAQAMMRSSAPAVLLGGSGTIVTERDVIAATARGRSPVSAAMLAGQVEPPTIVDQASVLEALAIMLRGGHHALVVIDDERRAVGLLTLATAAAALLGGTDVPSWLPALRMALHLEITLE